MSFSSLRMAGTNADEVAETFKMKVIFQGKKKSQVFENMEMTFSLRECFHSTLPPPQHTHTSFSY